MSFLQALNQNLAAVAHRTLDGLVQVSNAERGNGAGVIWRSDGLIVTNAHVVAAASARLARADSDLAVTLHDGRRVAAKLVALDTQRDLAALQVDAGALTPIALGDSRRLLPGDFVLAFGFPWGVQGGVTSGIVIGIGGDLPELGGREWLAASLHLRPGHSGGPLVDSRGCLVGINTLMNGPEVGVAIPVHVVQAFLGDALENYTQQQTPDIVRL